MQINLNDSQFQEKERKAIFNGGQAGIARDCSVSIKQRGADDPENAPKFKLIFKQEDGAEINRALFELKPDASIGSQQFFGREMNHLMNQFGFSIANTKAHPNDILKQVAKGVHENCTGKKFGVAVCYGTVERPKAFLEVDGFWGYRNEENITEASPLKLSAKAAQVRFEPTNNNPAPTAGNITGFELPANEQKEGDDGLPF